MSLNTHVWQNDQWVTRTLGTDKVLEANAPEPMPELFHASRPLCGLLTRTVVESPTVQFILPARLRDGYHNDIAFVSNYSIAIKEFGPDEQLKDFLKKSYSDSRIRNALVLGARPTDIKDAGNATHPFVKSEEDGDVDMGIFATPPPKTLDGSRNLAPQMLLLILECGDCVFLSVRSDPHTAAEIVTTRFRSPGPRHQMDYPGFHLTADPSSRYIALGCPADVFIVYELEAMDTIQEQARGEKSSQPVKSYRSRSVQGNILKMEFLHPSSGDEEHMVLLLIIARDGVSRMVIYEWQAGDNLKTVLEAEKNGHRMPEEHKIPLLLIPLTVRSAFLAVSENHIAMCRDFLYGPPNFEVCEITTSKPSENYFGRKAPVWTAWARPFRLQSFFQVRDCIYLARADGRVVFLEIAQDSTVEGSVPFNQFDCNISLAFCCLYDESSDILILGGADGPGQIWKAPPRSHPIPLGPVPNYAPTIDLATTDEFTTWNQQVGANGTRLVKWRHREVKELTQPDRVFVTSARGKKSSIAELQYGAAAKIGLILDCDEATKQLWLLPAGFSGPEDGYHLLMSTPDRTSVLHFSADLAELSEVNDKRFDLSSRTLAVAKIDDDLILQVTEKTAVLTIREESTIRSYRQPHDKLSGGDGPTVATDAVIIGRFVVLSTNIGRRFILWILYVQGKDVTVTRRLELELEVTCLSLGYISAKPYVLAGLWDEHRSPWLGLYPAAPEKDPGLVDRQIPLNRPEAGSDDGGGNGSSPIWAAASIASVVVRSDQEALVIGTRSGHVLTADLDAILDNPEYPFAVERLGSTTATVHPVYFNDRPAILVCCDLELTLMIDYDFNPASFQTKARVWPSDASDAQAVPPPVDAAVVVQPGISGIRDNANNVTLFLISGSRLLVAELQQRLEHLQRHMPVGGTANRVLYSHLLECLVVAVERDDKPSLMFLDPDTGEDLSKPTDKEGNDVEFISGLGDAEDRILALEHWHCKKIDQTWQYILVSTLQGKLIVVSFVPFVVPEGSGARPKVRYWTRWRNQRAGVEDSEPITAVLGLPDGVMCCQDDKLLWYAVDPAVRKLKCLKILTLEAPAYSLCSMRGRVAALTQSNGVFIVDYSPAIPNADMKIVHVDPWRRKLWNFIEVAGNAEAKADSSLLLVADKLCGVTGLWVPWYRPNSVCETIFDAELPAAVIRFRRGRTRPAWQDRRREGPEYGVLASTWDDAEIFGLCLDGTIMHFTVLGYELWQVLRFIQSLALASPEMYPSTYQAGADPTEYDAEPISYEDMHIDGNMIQRLLDARALERVVVRPRDQHTLRVLLAQINDPRMTAPIQGDDEAIRRGIFNKAYGVIKYLMSPVL